VLKFFWFKKLFYIYHIKQTKTYNMKTQVYILVQNGNQIVEGQVHERRESAEKICATMNKMSMQIEGRETYGVLEMQIYK